MEKEIQKDVQEEITNEDVQKEVNDVLAKTVEDLKAELKAENEAKMKEWMAEQKELMEKKAGLYNKEVKNDRSVMNDNLRKFVGALMVHDHATLKDMSSTAANGGYTIDTELAAEVEHLMTEFGVARREMNVVTLSKGDLKINNLATDVSVYWTDEAANKTSSEVTLGQVTLALKKLAVIVPMSDELLEDTEIDLVGFVTSRIAEKMAAAEDTQFFNGDGTTFTGVLQNTSVNEVTMTGSTFATIDADDLSDMVDATPQGALANGKFYMHRSIMSYIRKLKASDGTYIYQAPSAGGPATVWGYPVVLVEAMPSSSDSSAETSFVLFGDLKKTAWLGVKGGLRVKLADQATVRNTAGNADLDLFRRDMTALRVVERVGYVVVLPTAVTKLTTAAASA